MHDQGRIEALERHVRRRLREVSEIDTSRLSDLYHGRGPGYDDRPDGRSGIVMSDVRDAIESIKPELMDIFFGGDRVVEFSAVGPDDVESAEIETEAVNHVMTEAGGFEAFLGWFHAALSEGIGYIKRSWSEDRRSEVVSYAGLDEDGALMIVESGADVVGRADGPDGITLHVREVYADTSYRLDVVPACEVLVPRDWNKLSLRGCPFVVHRRSIPIHDLRGLGVSDRSISELVEGDDDLGDAREVDVKEIYLRHDLDGDGVQELVQVICGGRDDRILERAGGGWMVDWITSVPIVSICPVPLPGMHGGLSITELVEDLQALRTVIARQMIDNVVLSNNADWIVDSDVASGETIEDLLNPRPGRVIRVSGGASSVREVVPPQLVGQSMAALEFVEALKEQRTGVTRYSQGLDADSLNKTAEGIRRIMTAAQKKILLIARIFAETGVSDLMRGIHDDLRSGAMRSVVMEVGGGFSEISPGGWSRRRSVRVNVGLGTDNRDTQFARLAMLLGKQEQLLGTPLVDARRIYNTLRRMLEISGFKDVESFFADPQSAPGVPVPPDSQDPSLVAAEIEMRKIEAEAAVKQAELEIRRMEAETRRLDVMLRDDRERDLAAAKIEAEEAKRTGAPVDGGDLVR